MGQIFASLRRRGAWRKGCKLILGNSSLTIGLTIVALMCIVALVPESIATHNPNDHNVDAILQPPSAEHYFGTDNFGRDLYSRVVWGARVDLQLGLVAMIVPFVVGSLIGLLAGYYGRWIDALLMRILDIFLAFPFTLVIIVIVAIIGPGTANLYIAMWLVGWRTYARLIRSDVLVIRDAEYVQAARVLGYSDARILLRHILPNVVSSCIVYGASDVVMCMLAGAAMSFLGLGIQPPTPEWGALIAGGRAFISKAWWLTAMPGLCLAIAGTGFSLVGDGLSDLLRTKGR